MSSPVIHLVHPPPYGEVPFKNLGLCSVAAGLRRGGFETRYLDASERLHRQGRDFYDDLILRLSERAGDMTDLPRLDLLGEVLFPDHGDSALAATIRAQVKEMGETLGEAQVAGVTFNTLTAYAAAALGRDLRARGVKVFMGGPMSGILPITELMLRLGAADAIVVGEGDLVASDVVTALVGGRPWDAQTIPGALRLVDDEVRGAPPVALPSLDSLPRPELEGNVLDDFLPIGATRGCRRRCVYCSEPGIWTRFRKRSPSAVVEEMAERSVELGIVDFHFHDDLLNCSRRWFEELLGALAGRGFTFESFFEPYGLDRSLLERLAEVGCRLIKYGVQSFSPAVLGTMGRPARIDAMTAVLVATYELGISTHFDMLIGHPGESDEDHRANLRAIEALYERTGERMYFSLNPYYVAAGSTIWSDPARFGVELIEATGEGLPAPLAAALRRGPAYPERYRSGLSRDQIMGRMAELGEILKRHDKDYLYLGQDHVPAADGTGRGRRMLQPLPEEDADTLRNGRSYWQAVASRAAAVLRQAPRARSLLKGYGVEHIGPAADAAGLEVRLARGSERYDLIIERSGSSGSPGRAGQTMSVTNRRDPPSSEATAAIEGLLSILELISAKIER